MAQTWKEIVPYCYEEESAFNAGYTHSSVSSDYPGATFEKCKVSKPPSVYIIDASGTVRYHDLAMAVVDEAVERVVSRE